MALTFIGLIGFFAFIAFRSSAPNMTLLYGDLTTGDSTAIAAKLDVADIPFDISEDGTQINVGKSDVGRARMLLAEEGLPGNGSMGYELFDKQQSFGTTSFVQNINQLRALEGELARTIGTLDPIKTARVHLVLPQRELFSRESQPATASVFVDLRNSAEVGREQILAIQQLVASSVPQLKPTRVTIIDANGNLLARGDEEEGGAISAQSSEDIRLKYEHRIKRQIEDMVSRVVGHGRVRAIVSADLDFNVVTRNSEIYDPEGQVVRSTQVVEEEDIDNSGKSTDNTVTVENNLPGLPGNANTQNNSNQPTALSNRLEEVVNYEISRTVENIVQESGEVNKLSVAVLVDGQYETIPAPPPAEGAEDSEEEAKPEYKYIPRSDAELEQIRTLVKSAVGFDERRGDTLEVINMQFARDEFFTDGPKEETILGLPKDDVMSIAETLILSLVAVLIILLVLRPLVSHVATAATMTAEAKAANEEKEAKMLAAAAQQAQLAPPGADGMPLPEGEMGELDATLDMQNVEGQVKQSSIKKIHDLVDSHPAETVSVIRNWMTQEN
jgi:flagellar M-ring protein FliF